MDGESASRKQCSLAKSGDQLSFHVAGNAVLRAEPAHFLRHITVRESYDII